MRTHTRYISGKHGNIRVMRVVRYAQIVRIIKGHKNKVSLQNNHGRIHGRK